MAQAKAKANLSFKAVITLELSEQEAAALNEMTKYGIEPFLKGYHKMLGQHYIQPHEKGLTSLFKTIDTTLPFQLSKLEEYKKAVCEAAGQFNAK